MAVTQAQLAQDDESERQGMILWIEKRGWVHDYGDMWRKVISPGCAVTMNLDHAYRYQLYMEKNS